MASLFSVGGGREYVLRIVADVKDATKGLDEVVASSTSMKDKVVGVGSAIKNALTSDSVVQFGKDALAAAGQANLASGQVNRAFGDAAKTVLDFSKTTATSMGLSSQEFNAMAGKMGNMLVSMGVDAHTAANSTIELSKRANDMAKAWGTSTEQAANAVTMALAGNTRGLRQFGVSISSADIQARAMAKGYVDASGKVTQAGKAIAAQELIMEKTTNVAGRWEQASGSLGSQQKILAAQFKDLQANIGQALIPVMLKLMDVLRPLIDFGLRFANVLAPIAAIIAGVVIALKAYEMAMMAWKVATEIARIAQLALNASFLTNPIFLVVAAIAALVAGLVWAYNNVEWFRNAVDAMGAAVVAAFNWVKDAAVAVFNWIKDNWPLLLAILTGPFGTAVYLIVKNWDTIKDAVITAYNTVKDWIGKIPSAVQNALSGLFNIIKAPFEQAWNWIKQIPGWITDAFSSVVNALNNVWGRIYDILTYPFKKAFEGIKYLWNSTVGKISFTIPSWVPLIGGKGFSFPQMAKGGIVTKPTLALIGEAGPEAVVPLSNGTGVVPTQTIVNINVYAMTANAEVGRRVYQALEEYERVSGKGIA